MSALARLMMIHTMIERVCRYHVRIIDVAIIIFRRFFTPLMMPALLALFDERAATGARAFTYDDDELLSARASVTRLIQHASTRERRVTMMDGASMPFKITDVR